MARYLIEFQSKYLLRKTEVIIYIPSMNLAETLRNNNVNYYKENQEKFPLLILLSGFGSTKTAWEQNSNVMQFADKYRVSLCMVSCENKWYLNYSPTDRYADFINIELLDYLYGTFKNLDDKKYIVGCSMGGYGALRNYLENPGLYDGCCSLSPAIKADNNLEETLKLSSLKDLITKAENPNVYLSIGGDDFIIKQSLEFDEYLKSINSKIRYNVIPGYQHSFDLWNLEIEKYIKSIKEN